MDWIRSSTYNLPIVVSCSFSTRSENQLFATAHSTARSKAKFYYAELRQEMLSTIRLGNCTFDPYWFGIADKNMLTTALYSSGLFSPESSFALSDDMHYNRAKAGFGLSFQSVMAHFRIYGYIPLVYSHISVYSPYITPKNIHYISFRI